MYAPSSFLAVEWNEFFFACVTSGVQVRMQVSCNGNTIQTGPRDPAIHNWGHNDQGDPRMGNPRTHSLEDRVARNCCDRNANTSSLCLIVSFIACKANSYAQRSWCPRLCAYWYSFFNHEADSILLYVCKSSFARLVGDYIL